MEYGIAMIYHTGVKVFYGSAAEVEAFVVSYKGEGRVYGQLYPNMENVELQLKYYRRRYKAKLQVHKIEEASTTT